MTKLHVFSKKVDEAARVLENKSEWLLFEQTFKYMLMLCAIWYHLYNLKNITNTHGGVLLLVKLQVWPWNFAKRSSPLWVLFTFFKLYKWYQTAQSISYVKLVWNKQPMKQYDVNSHCIKYYNFTQFPDSKFCGNAQFPQIFEWFTQYSAERVRFHKISTTGN